MTRIAALLASAIIAHPAPAAPLTGTFPSIHGGAIKPFLD